jgi:hypothetical protein
MRHRCLWAVLLVLALGALASAQETTGTLTGRVKDPQGLALPGATVTLTGPQGVKTFVSDGEGRFLAPFLVPGLYSVRAELDGFKVFEQSDIVVSLGQTVELSLMLQVGGIEETIQVKGETPLVDQTRTTTGQVISSDMLGKVPTGRTFADSLYLAPGVSATTTGQANPSISGGSGLDNQYVVDGVNLTNAGYGALGSYSIYHGSLGTATPFDFIKEVQVKTGGYEAEFGQSTGGVINVVTKSGSNLFKGSVFGYSRLDALEAKWKQYQTDNGTVQVLGSEQSDFGGEMGGRIIRNKLFFFAAINPSWTTQTFKAPEGFPLESLGGQDRDRRTMSYSTKGTWQATASHRLDVSVFGDPSHGNMGPQRTSSLTVTNTASFSEIDYGGHNQTVRYDGIFGGRWLVEASLARAINSLSELPSVNEWRVTDRTVVPNVITGGIGFYESGNDGENLQYAVKSTHIFGGHSLRYGFLFEDVAYNNVNQRTGPTFVANGRETATGANIDIISDPVFGRIWRVIRANYNSVRETDQTYWNLFVQDSWKVNDRLTVNPGLRYEQQTLNGMLVKGFDLKNNWAPRVGVVYDVLGTGRSKLYGNYGRYFARVPNDMAVRALSADEGMSRADYFDAGLTQPIPDGVLAGNYTTHFVALGQHPSLIDEDVQLSYKDEFVVGYEYEVFKGTSLGVRYIRRTIGSILEDIAPFPLVAADLGIEGAATADYILTNPTADTPTAVPELGATFEDPIHNYDAVEFTLEKRFSDNWMMTGSYRWSRLHGTFEGFFREDNGQSDPGLTSLYDFPTNDPSYTAIGVPEFRYRGDIRYLGKLGEGPLPLDRPHQVKLFGNYAFNMGLTVAASFSAASGRPLTALAANPNYGNDSEIPEGPRGSGIQTIDGFKKRTPVHSQLDLQASYLFTLGDQQLTLLADVFNVFNQKTTLMYDVATESTIGVENPDFGTPTSLTAIDAVPQFQAPFAMRLGVRFAW